MTQALTGRAVERKWRCRQRLPVRSPAREDQPGGEKAANGRNAPTRQAGLSANPEPLAVFCPPGTSKEKGPRALSSPPQPTAGIRASPAQAVFTHFWIKLFLAALASFLSAAVFALVALSAAPSVFTHFWIKPFWPCRQLPLSAATFSHWLAFGTGGGILTHFCSTAGFWRARQLLHRRLASHARCAPRAIARHRRAFWATPIPMPTTATHRLNITQIRFHMTNSHRSIHCGWLPHSRGQTRQPFVSAAL